MIDGLRINGVKRDTLYTEKPSFAAGGAAFFDGNAGESPAEMEERLWIEAVREDKDPVTLPEQAYVVTQILEGIYTSAKTGNIVFFDN